MKRPFLAAALLSALVASSTDFYLAEWHDYKAAHGKSYRTPEEDALRLDTYLANRHLIEEHNTRYRRGETRFTMAINKFADWLPEELDRLNGLRASGARRRGRPFQKEPGAVVPKEINWVLKGAVTAVRDQGRCGSCYAFSAVGALEGLMFRTNKSITELSVQELVDCSECWGCSGGLMDYCFEYVKGHGIEAEDSYPYEGRDGLCRVDERKVAASCTGYKEIGEKNEEALMEAVGTVGPVSIAFAVSRAFAMYSGGIFDGNCSSGINHGMLAVGYGTDEEVGEDYWLVKNSWGADWGEAGYVRVVRNQDKCRISEQASYPVYE